MKTILIFLSVLFLSSCSSSNNDKKHLNQISMKEAEGLLLKTFHEDGIVFEKDTFKRYIINKVLDRNVVYKDTSTLNYFYLSDLDYFNNQSNIILVNTNEAMKSDKIDHFFDISFDPVRDNKLTINITFQFKNLIKGYITTQSHSMMEFVFEKKEGKWIFKEKIDPDSFIIGKEYER